MKTIDENTIQSYQNHIYTQEKSQNTIDKYIRDIRIKQAQKLLDQRYLRMARIWAENSYCKRRQVGALVVKDKMIISDGYNGTPSGFENVCEDETTSQSRMSFTPKPTP